MYRSDQADDRGVVGVSLPQYPEYKDSGHPHISKVPSQWEIKPLKHCLRLITEKAAGKSSPIALENIEGWSARYLPSESDFEGVGIAFRQGDILRSEEHTSELQSRPHLVCRLLLEKKNHD